MKTAKVSFYISVPDKISLTEVRDFLNFKLQIFNQINMDNPLEEFDQLGPHLLKVEPTGWK